MEHPVVCWLIPCYNVPDINWMRSCIASLHSQNIYWQAVIVDDGSTDPKIWEQLYQYSQLDNRITAVRAEHGGVARALNTAYSVAKQMEESRGITHYARIDVDDYNDHDRLVKQVAFMKAHEVGLVGAGMRVDWGHGLVDIKLGCDSDPIEYLKHKHTPCFHPTWLIAKESMMPYSEDYPHAEDIAWLCTYLRNGGKLANYPDPLITKRQHPGRVSSVYKEIQIQSRERAVKEILGE